MSSDTQEAQQHRAEADQLPDGDIVGIILRHHADITDAIGRLKAARGANRVAGWEALTKLLKAHETAEQQLVRPVIEKTGKAGEAQARQAEETQADAAIAKLTALGADTPEFGEMFAQFADQVHDHAEAEEREELPLLKQLSEQERAELGTQFMAAFHAAG